MLDEAGGGRTPLGFGIGGWLILLGASGMLLSGLGAPKVVVLPEREGIAERSGRIALTTGNRGMRMVQPERHCSSRNKKWHKTAIGNRAVSNYVGHNGISNEVVFEKHFVREREPDRRKTMSKRKLHPMFAVVASLTGLALAGCGEGDSAASFQAAAQSYLDAHRECYDLAAAIALPAGKRLSGEAARYEVTVPGYDADRVRIAIRKLQDEKMLLVDQLDSGPASSSYLVPPVRFAITVRVPETMAAHLDADGRRVCSSMRVQETLSLGKPFERNGETFRIGRFRLSDEGPALPNSPEREMQKMLIGLASGGKAPDRTRVEITFRTGAGAPTVVQIGPAQE